MFRCLEGSLGRRESLLRRVVVHGGLGVVNIVFSQRFNCGPIVVMRAYSTCEGGNCG